MASKSMSTLIIPVLLLTSVTARTHKKPVVSRRCTLELENINLAPGEETASKVKCALYSCFQNGTGTTLRIKSCVLRPLQPGCYYTEELVGKAFPHCCPVVVCDPHLQEDLLHRYQLDQSISEEDVPFNLTDLDDYSGVIESYELNQRGASECIDSTGHITMEPGRHHEDRLHCTFYSCIRSGNTLRLRVASCFHEKPGHGCHTTPLDSTKAFPKCCPVTTCKGDSRKQAPGNEVNKPNSSRKCYIWNQHLALSEGGQVQINGGCGLYTCMARGQLKISGCSRAAAPPPGCSYSKPDLNKPFPRCCPTITCTQKTKTKLTELREKCFVKNENLFLNLGQSMRSRMECALYTCLSCGKLQTTSCDLQPPSAGCHYPAADLNKPFPECCPKMVCKTDTEQQVVEQVNRKDLDGLTSAETKENTEEFIENIQAFVKDNYINRTSGECSVGQANKELHAKGICGRYFCVQNDHSQRIVFSRCSAKPAQPHCVYYKGDMSQQFPRCCPVTVCRNLEVQTGQHVILGTNLPRAGPGDLSYQHPSGTIQHEPITDDSSGNPGICSHPTENIKLEVGQHLIMKGKCAQYFCKMHGSSPRLEISSCVKRPLPAGCHYTMENFVKPFPGCCPVVICMTQHTRDLQHLQREFPFVFRPENRNIKEADINVDISGSNTLTTDVLAHFHTSGIANNNCHSSAEKLDIPVGSVVNVKGKCAQYSCVPEGNLLLLKYSSCSRKQVPPGCYQVKGDLSKEFPYCCPIIKCESQEITIVAPSKCVHPEDNVTLTEGQVTNVKSSCTEYSCTRVGNKLQLRQRSCDKSAPLPPGCHYTKADKTKPFPGCCSAVECRHLVAGRRRQSIGNRLGAFKPHVGYPQIYFKNKRRQRRQGDAIAETSGKCYVWEENVKLSAGEQIRAKGQCILYSCISDGAKTLLKTYSCTFNTVRPGCTYIPEDLTMPFPECCPKVTCRINGTHTTFPRSADHGKAPPAKCYHEEEKLLISPGSVAYGKRNCQKYTCTSRGNINKLETERCNPIDFSMKCSVKEGDPTKPYPDCCTVKECFEIA